MIATSRVKVAGPQKGRKGIMRSEEGEKPVVVGQIRKRVSVAAVRAQCYSLLGRLEMIGPGSAAAAGRRRSAENQERRWRRERQAIVLSERQGRNIVRKGFAKL